jgi:PAS domain-containing protein
MNNPSSSTLSSNANWGPLKIAGLYLLIGGLWILFSDQLAPDHKISTPDRISYIKAGDISVTAFLLYWFIRQHMRRYAAARNNAPDHRCAPGPHFICNADQRYQFTNKAYEEWFGHGHRKTPGEMLGEGLQDNFRLLRALRGNVTYETEMRMGRQTRFVNATYVPDRGKWTDQGFLCIGTGYHRT